MKHILVDIETAGTGNGAAGYKMRREQGIEVMSVVFSEEGRPLDEIIKEILLRNLHNCQLKIT